MKCGWDSLPYLALCMILPWTATVCLFVLLPAVADAESLKVLPDTLDGVPPNKMLHNYLMKRAHEAIDKKLAKFEKIVKDPEQIAAYQQRRRDFFVEQIGGFPQRTPLNAKVVGRQQRDGYDIEKVILESRPGLFVTAILYLPKAKPPYPAVLVPCGHSLTGKARDLYQRAPILIAKNGMAALCYDPVEQGERVQLSSKKNGGPYGGGVMGHQMMGVGCILLGRNVAAFRIWDGMRCLDYLQSRKDIDPKRIGCTGISGGGTLTSYLMALDDRIAAAAPGCYLTSLRRHIDTTGPQDAEQNIYGQIAFGMGHEDYVLMRAPKPTLMLTTTDDCFDIHGAWETFRMAKRLYDRLGHSERIDLLETAGGHSFTPDMRVASCRWMRRWLLYIDDAIVEDKEPPVFPEKELWCTPQGRAVFLPGARTTYDMNIELDKQLGESRKKLWQGTDTAKALDEVRTVTGIRRLSDLPAPQSEQIATIQRDGYRIQTLILKPDPRIWLPALAFVPDQNDGQAYLYVHADGKEADAAPGGPIEQLVRKNHLVLAVDLRGLGETLPPKKAEDYGGHMNAEWQDIYLAYMLGTSYLTMRSEDILIAARFLKDYMTKGNPNLVHVVSVGNTGPSTLHAAALEPQLFASIRLHGSLISWSNVVGTPKAKRQLVNVVHGALKVYDLPDLLAALPSGKVTVTEPLDATEQPVKKHY